MEGRAARTALVLLCLAAPLAQAGMPAAADESFETSARLAGEYAEEMRSFLPLLEGPAEPRLLAVSVADARRAVAEIDRVVAAAPALGSKRADALALRRTAAAAHLHLALFETRAFDFDRARAEVDRAREILGSDAADGFRAEWSIVQDGAPGRALVSRCRYLSLEEFESALQVLWSSARPVVFDLSDLATKDLAGLELETGPGSPVETPERPPVGRPTALLRAAIASGERTFPVPLPSGTYRLRGAPGTGVDRTFVVPESAEVDPVVVGRARFALSLEPADRSRGPRFFLNGVEVTDLGSMPYGYYRVKADESFIKAVPERIRFIPGLGVDNRSRSTWTVFVPEGKMGVLRFGSAPLGGRLPDSP